MVKRILLVAAVLVAFTACSNNDEPDGGSIPSTKAEVLSTVAKRWLTDESTGYRSFQLNEDGTYIIEKVVNGTVEQRTGTYTLADDLRTLTLSGESSKLVLETLTADKVSFKFNGISFVSKGVESPEPKQSFPSTKTEVLSMVAKRWLTNESTGYKSFQLNEDGTYIIEKMVNGTVEQLTGTYTLADDLHTVTLSGESSKLVLETLTADKVSFTFNGATFVSTGIGDSLSVAAKYYAFCYSEGVNEYVEFNVETGAATLSGYKLTGYNGNGRGYVFSKERNEVIMLGYNDNFDLYINRIDLSTKALSAVKVATTDAISNFDNIVTYNGKFYAFCYDEDINELFELNVESGAIVGTGYKLTGYNGNGRGYVFSKERNELVMLGYDDDFNLYINRVSLSTKAVTAVKVVTTGAISNFDSMVTYNGKFYAYCYDEGIDELFELNLETGELISTGYRLTGMQGYNYGYVFSKERNELITLTSQGNDMYIRRINLTTKAVTTVKATTTSAMSTSFGELVIRNF